MKIILSIAAVLAALIFTSQAFAWHANGVSRDCTGTITITQSEAYPGAYVVSDNGSTVVIGWSTGETQTFEGVNKPESCEQPVTTPPELPCGGKGYPDGYPSGKDGEEGNDDCAPHTKPLPPLVIEVGPSVPPSTTTSPSPSSPAPSVAAPVPSVPSSQTSGPVTKKGLEQGLKKQSSKVAAAGAERPQAAGELPYTGLSLWYAVALGLALVASGLYLRRRRVD